jgi:hypothetical protein
LPPDINASPVDIRAVLGSATPPGRLHRAVDGAIQRAVERGFSADLVDLGTLELGFAGGTPTADLDDDTAATITAPETVEAIGEPLSLGAKAVKPTSHRR